MYFITNTFYTYTIIVIYTISRSGCRNGFGCSVYIIITDLSALVIITSDTIIIEVAYLIVYDIDTIILVCGAYTTERNTIITSARSICRTSNNFIAADIQIFYIRSICGRSEAITRYHNTITVNRRGTCNR
ncbi:hypothetical protein D3C72_1107030 [compost metagenome]